MIGKLAQTAPAPTLCPRCAYRTINNGSGFCGPCNAAHRKEVAIERDRQETLARRARWKQRTSGASSKSTDTPENWRDRQQRHRLLTRMRPNDPATANADPLVLGQEAVMTLTMLRRVYGPNRPELAHRLEQVAETIRRLAWGPDDLT